VFLRCLAVAAALLFLLSLHAWFTASESSPVIKEWQAMVQRYDLADLCLFTDALYTRNPVLTDLTTAFQDHPAALEHFPSGTLVAPRQRGSHGLD